GGGGASPSPFLPSPLLFPSPLHLNFFYLVLGDLESAVGSVWDDCGPIISTLSPNPPRRPVPASSSPRAFSPFVHDNIPLYHLLNSIPLALRARYFRPSSISHPRVSLHGMRTLDRTRPADLQFAANL
ncbi:uncharacterized protein N7518_003872, partial [Penicillium psychrosexuale]|uniref:uncharacterized protein n=1 Tax=Penicillium psychrosexuale TaxID=1002107 RepID=UPI002545A8B9